MTWLTEVACQTWERTTKRINIGSPTSTHLPTWCSNNELNVMHTYFSCVGKIERRQWRIWYRASHTTRSPLWKGQNRAAQQPAPFPLDWEESESYTPMTHSSVEPRQCPIWTEIHMRNPTCYFYYLTVKYLKKNTPELAVKCKPEWSECWRILSLPPVWPCCSGGTSASRWTSIWFSWDHQIRKK